jgi:Calcineurin-like phosphoesterase
VPALRPVNKRSIEPVESGADFTFAVTGDGRPTVPGMPFPRITAAIFRELGLIGPRFVLYPGDAIFGYQSTRGEMIAELDAFAALADTAGVPVFNVPGNHEMQSRPEAAEILREWGHDEYGSFDCGGDHFIGLNTDQVNLEGRITGAQLEWLRRDLDAAGGARTFVFLHRPLFSWFQGDFNEDDARLLHELFRSHGVEAVFSAHDHFFYEERHDGVRYFTVGGAGGPLYTQPPAGGFAHYVLVTVSGSGVDYNVVEPGHVELDVEEGNDGTATRSVTRLTNTTDRDLVARSVPFRVPRRPGTNEFQVSAIMRDFTRTESELPTAVRRVPGGGVEEVTLAVEVRLPTGCAVWVTVKAGSSPPSPAPAAPSSGPPS